MRHFSGGPQQQKPAAGTAKALPAGTVVIGDMATAAVLGLLKQNREQWNLDAVLLLPCIALASCFTHSMLLRYAATGLWLNPAATARVGPAKPLAWSVAS